MLRKGGSFAFIVLVLLFGTLFVSAEASNFQSIRDNVETIKETGDILADSDERSNFIFSKLQDFREDSFLTAPLNLVESVLSSLNFIWNFILGIEFSFSVVFFLTLLFWVYFIILIYRGSKLIESPFLSWGTFGFFAIMISLEEFALKLSNLLIFSVSSLEDWRVQVFVWVLIGVVAVLLLGLSSKFIPTKLDKLKKKVEENKQELEEAKEKSQEIEDNVKEIIREGKAKGNSQEEINSLVEEYLREMKGYLPEKELKKFDYSKFLK